MDRVQGLLAIAVEFGLAAFAHTGLVPTPTFREECRICLVRTRAAIDLLARNARVQNFVPEQVI